MRVALVTDYYLPTLGGVQTVVKAQLEGLRAAGHEATVFAPLAIEPDSADVVALPISRRFRPDGYPFTRSARAAEAVMRAEFVARGIDVVHVQSEMFAALGAYRAAAALDLPVVFTVHGRVDVYAAHVLPLPWLTTGLLAHLHSRHVDHSRMAVPRGLPFTRTLVARRMWRVMLAQARASAAVTVPSPHVARMLGQLGCATPVTVLPNALEDTLIDSIGTPTRRARRGEPLRVMWCGRVSPEKRPEVFVEAARLAGAGIVADMYGDGVARGAIARSAPAVGVRVHGAVPQDQVLRAMARHDAFVSSSLDFDNQPMVLLEAIASGLAVVVADPELAVALPQGATRVSSTPDAEGLARELSRLRDEPGALERASAASIASAPATRIGPHVEGLLAVYTAVARS